MKGVRGMEHYSPYVKFAGLYFDLPVVVMSTVTALLVLLLVVLATRKMTAGVPKGLQNFF